MVWLAQPVKHIEHTINVAAISGLINLLLLMDHSPFDRTFLDQIIINGFLSLDQNVLFQLEIVNLGLLRGDLGLHVLVVPDEIGAGDHQYRDDADLDVGEDEHPDHPLGRRGAGDPPEFIGDAVKVWERHRKSIR